MNFQPDERMKQDYIQNKLSPDAKNQFEMWLFEHPSEQEELELDLILKSGVKKYFEEEAEAQSDKVSWMPAFGVAAAFVLMTWGLLMPRDEKISEGLVVPQVSIFSHVRSAEQLVWSLRNDQEQLIQIPVPYMSADLYTVEIKLLNDSSVEPKKVNDLVPDHDLVSILIPKGELAIGSYSLILKNQKDSELQEFNFEVK